MVHNEKLEYSTRMNSSKNISKHKEVTKPLFTLHAHPCLRLTTGRSFTCSHNIGVNDRNTQSTEKCHHSRLCWIAEVLSRLTKVWCKFTLRKSFENKFYFWSIIMHFIHEFWRVYFYQIPGNLAYQNSKIVKVSSGDFGLSEQLVHLESCEKI